MDEMDDISRAMEAEDTEALKESVRIYAQRNAPPPGAVPIGPDIVSGDGTRQRRLLDRDPRWLAGLYYNVGNDCLRKKKYALAEAMYREAIGEGYDDPSAWNNLAVTYKRREDYEGAATEYRNLIGAHPAYVPSYGRLAILLMAYMAHDVSAVTPYLSEFIRRGGTSEQLRAFTDSMPAVEVAAGGAISGWLEDRARKQRKVGRNDSCHCGSGKKFKRCCGDPASPLG